jgi:hypothetical protein
MSLFHNGTWRFPLTVQMLLSPVIAETMWH